VRFEVELLLGVGPARPSYVPSTMVLLLSDRSGLHGVDRCEFSAARPGR
jgi:hypothetical protein